jgi:flagellar hook-length control protein FliK
VPTVATLQSLQVPLLAGGDHAGAGSDGHPGTPGETGAGTLAATAGVPTSGEQPTSLFSVDASSQNHGTQPAAAALPDGPVRTSVHLQEAVDAVRATFTAANQAGISSARISLTPASLGGIKISLTQTPDGLVARVAADHPETAQTLQQNAGDLRRSLEASGMSLLRLDIGSSGQQSLAGFTGSDQNGSPSSGSGNWASPAGDTADGDETQTPTELTIELTSGFLVNVLA